MSCKMNSIPFIGSYDDIRREMEADLQYRLENRTWKTSLGRPLYYRINVQMIVTEECPFSCPFCLERQNPMTGNNDFMAQIESLKRVLAEHPDARLTITGGEPGLYPEHISDVVDTFKKYGNNVFCSINTSGFNTALNGPARINLSRNDYVHEDPSKFPGCTVQTIMETPAASPSDSSAAWKRKTIPWMSGTVCKMTAKSMCIHSESVTSLCTRPSTIWGSTPA